MIDAIDLSAQDILFSIFLKVLSSFIFIFLLLYLFRPNVKISPNICYLKLPNEDGKDEYYYVFKIVNRSRFSTFDVKIRLHERAPHIVNTGTKINHRRIEIDSSVDSKKDIYMPGYKRAKGVGDHAYLIRTKTDISEILSKQESVVRLSVTSKHSLTNLTRLVVTDFNSIDCIYKNKGFVFGRSLKPVS